MGKYSNEVKKKFSSMCSNFLPNTKVNIIWNSSWKLRNLFTFKDRLPMRLRSTILYRFTCNGCNSIYVGKTKRHFLVRTHEHLGLSLRTGKKFTCNPKHSNNSGILEHLHHSGDCNDFFLCIKESLLLQEFKPNINSKSKSIPLQLFEI